MAVRKISTRMAIEGESEYRAGVSKIGAELKTLGSELKLVESNFKGQSNSMAALTAKGTALKNIYDKQAEKVALLAAELKNAQTAQTTYNARIDETKSKITANDAAMDKLRASASDTTEEQKQLATATEKLKNELAELTTREDAAARGVNKIQGEYAEANAKLNTWDNELRQNDGYLDEAKRSADKCATSIDNMGRQTAEATTQGGLLGKIFAGGFFANIASQALSTVVSWLKQFATAALDAADKYSTLADVTGLTTERLQELNYAGVRLDVSLDTMTDSFKKLINNMAGARDGLETPAAAFEKLGIEVTDTNGNLRDSNVVFGEVIDALGAMRNATERDAAAQDILGRSATDLNPLIKAGSEALAELSEEAENTGAVMSDEAVQGLDNLGETIEQTKIKIKAFIGETIYAGMQSNSAMEEQAETLAVLLGAKEAEVEVTNELTEAEQTAADTTTALSDEVYALKTAYDEAKTAATEALDSAISKWGEMDNAAVTSAADVLAALQSQVEWMNNYQSNLDALEGRTIEGVDTSELVKSLSDGTTESASILAGLAAASDEDIAAIVESMGKVTAGKDSLSDAMAEATNDFSEQMDAMKEKAAVTIEGMNMSVEAGEASADTMQGYIDECYAMIPDLEAAFSEAGTAANQAYRDAQESKSPSKKAREATADYFSGLIKQAEDMTPDLESAFSEAAGAADKASKNALSEFSATNIISNTNDLNISGTIRVEGVNTDGEMVAADDLVVDSLNNVLRRQARH